MHEPPGRGVDREPAVLVDLGRDGARLRSDLDHHGGVVAGDPAVDAALQTARREKPTQRVQVSISPMA